MNISEVEKIKGLVNTSPILSLAERAEWLGLLDVMNDRQLLELEGILGSEVGKSENRKSEVGSRNLIIDNQKAVSSAVNNNQSKTEGLANQGMQMPKMSHIMNLPNLGGLGKIPNSKFQIPNQSQQPIIQKKPSVFADKLKMMFREKELPAGERELELTQGVESRKYKVESRKPEAEKPQEQKDQVAAPKPFFPVKETPPVVPKAPATAPKVPLPPVPRPKNIFPAPAVLPKALPVLNPVKEPTAVVDNQRVQSQSSLAPASSSALPNSEKPPVEPMKRKTIFADNLVVGNIFQNFRPVDLENDQQPKGLGNMPTKPVNKAPDDQKFSAGISFPAMSQAGKIRAEEVIKKSSWSPPLSLNSVKEPTGALDGHQSQDHFSPSSILPPTFSNGVKSLEQTGVQSGGPELNTLENLAKLLPEFLDSSSLDFLVKKIKLLIGKYGYFEVVFNIEKSGAYKNYISTGLKLLSGQSGFEGLGGDYLSKEQFEKFTDLLAKIQVG